MEEQDNDYKKIIEEREAEDVNFELFKNTFNVKCEKCGRKTAKFTFLMGCICLYCNSYLIEKKDTIIL